MKCAVSPTQDPQTGANVALARGHSDTAANRFVHAVIARGASYAVACINFSQLRWGLIRVGSTVDLPPAVPETGNCSQSDDTSSFSLPAPIRGI